MKANLYLNKSGFFLVEILIAVYICSICSLVVVSSHYVHRHSEEVIENYVSEMDQSLFLVYEEKEICNKEE